MNNDDNNKDDDHNNDENHDDITCDDNDGDDDDDDDDDDDGDDDLVEFHLKALNQMFDIKSLVHIPASVYVNSENGTWRWLKSVYLWVFTVFTVADYVKSHLWYGFCAKMWIIISNT